MFAYGKGPGVLRAHPAARAARTDRCVPRRGRRPSARLVHHRSRTPARAAGPWPKEGRATIGLALGLIVVLLVSGVIEAFVTPSPLPTWARILIGLGAEAAFLSYVIGLGRRAIRAGLSGDIEIAPDTLPVAANKGHNCVICAARLLCIES